MRRAADLVGRSLRDDLSAVLSRPRTHVDNVIGGQDRIGVVLDDDHAVAQIAQMLECRQQPIVVALVQADRRLVEHVHDAGEARPDLRGQPDALRLAARERLRGAVERKVVEADVVEELQPAHDPLTDLVAERMALSFELQLAKELVGFLQRTVADLVERALVAGRTDLDVPRLTPQPRALALGTGLRVQIFGELLADHDRIGFAITALEVRDDALERVLARHRLAAVGQILERDFFLVAAV